MRPIKEVTDIQWEMYRRTRYYNPKQSQQTEKVQCTFKEAMEKAARDRELIDLNDRSYDWKAR